MIKALILNSPFLDWNLPAGMRRIGVPVVSALGRFFPGLRVRQNLTAAMPKRCRRSMAVNGAIARTGNLTYFPILTWAG